MKKISSAFLLIILFFAGPNLLFSQIFEDDWIEGDFWVELDPAVQETETEYPLTKEDAARRALEEARYVFSGIVFGFRFSYMPSDKNREVKEFFDIVPLFQIPWGDPNLSVRGTRREEDIYIIKIRYTPEVFLLYRLDGWRSNAIPRSAGLGTGNLFQGYKEKIAAVENGIKSAVRTYAQGKVFNKPREITGEAALEGIPYIIIDSGEYRAKVSVRLRNLDIIPYSTY